MEQLVDFPTLALQIVASTRDPVALPEMAGSSIRGAFGAALKRLVCVRTDLAHCAPCEMLQSCAYPYLFETTAPENTPGTSGFETPARPYVIRSAPGVRVLGVGELITWEMVLIGRAISFLPYFALAWQAMGQAGIGRGRGRFQLEEIASVGLDGGRLQTLYTRETNLLGTPQTALGPQCLWQWIADTLPRSSRLSPNPPAPASCDPLELEIEFLTPTSLKHQGKPVSSPAFHLLWRNLQRRLSLLRLAHGEGRPALDFAGTIALSTSIQLISSDVRPYTWQRYSRRQDQRVPMKGFVGTARYHGNLLPFLPALLLGSVVGVGDNCTFGHGHYRLKLILAGSDNTGNDRAGEPR